MATSASGPPSPSPSASAASTMPDMGADGATTGTQTTPSPVAPSVDAPAPAPPAERRVLVIVNPIGGDGRGRKIVAKEVEPALRRAGLTPEVYLTKGRGDAFNLGKTHDLGSYWALVSVSGDGMLNEIVNGIWDRPDRAEVLKRVLVAIYPAGTGNGLATSVGLRRHARLADELAGSVQRSWCTPMDLLEATVSGRVHIATLSVCWGFIAEHDTYSEQKLRWMGRGMSTTLAPLLALAKRRMCRGRLAFKPAPHAPPFTSKGPKPVLQLEDGFVAMEGRFFGVMICNVPFLATDVCMAPMARFSDGYADMVVIHAELPFAQLVKALLALEEGSHVRMPGVDYVKVSAVRIDPTPPFAADEVYAMDGELVPLAPLEVKVLPSQLTTVVSPQLTSSGAPVPLPKDAASTKGL